MPIKAISHQNHDFSFLSLSSPSSDKPFIRCYLLNHHHHHHLTLIHFLKMCSLTTMSRCTLFYMCVNKNIILIEWEFNKAQGLVAVCVSLCQVSLVY